MLLYRYGHIEITIALEEPADLACWLEHLRPLIAAIPGLPAATEIRHIERLAAELVSTPGRTYAETGHGLLTVTYPHMFT